MTTVAVVASTNAARRFVDMTSPQNFLMASLSNICAAGDLRLFGESSVNWGRNVGSVPKYWRMDVSERARAQAGQLRYCGNGLALRTNVTVFQAVVAPVLMRRELCE